MDAHYVTSRVNEGTERMPKSQDSVKRLLLKLRGTDGGCYLKKMPLKYNVLRVIVYNCGDSVVL